MVRTAAALASSRAPPSAMRGGVRRRLQPFEPPPPYVPTVRAATWVSASKVSAPPYGRLCIRTGHRQARQ